MTIGIIEFSDDKQGGIQPATYATYSDWIRGDMMKRGKQEHYLREILEGVLKRYASQVTWNGFAGDLSIDHPATVADYLALLERMDAVRSPPGSARGQARSGTQESKECVLHRPIHYARGQADRPQEWRTMLSDVG
jgi:hypothetical protein